MLACLSELTLRIPVLVYPQPPSREAAHFVPCDRVNFSISVTITSSPTWRFSGKAAGLNLEARPSD
ncbi:hypothetical protein CC77DRAFT_1022096, partial [Alternaria alternata]